MPSAEELADSLRKETPEDRIRYLRRLTLELMDYFEQSDEEDLHVAMYDAINAYVAKYRLAVKE